jgi:predicted RNA binding protein YcfA (HicA-like mRNA interferase family)
MKGYYKLLTDLLKQHGFEYKKQGKGSHEIWKRGSQTAIVPFNCYSRHLANQVLKDADIDHHF